MQGSEYSSFLEVTSGQIVDGQDSLRYFGDQIRLLVDVIVHTIKGG